MTKKRAYLNPFIPVGESFQVIEHLNIKLQQLTQEFGFEGAPVSECSEGPPNGVRGAVDEEHGVRVLVVALFGH